MNNAQLLIKQAAELLAETQGVPARGVCPVCHGGTEREQSLSVWRGEANVDLAMCHRATCQAHGAVRLGGIHASFDKVPARPPHFKATPADYVNSAEPLGAEEMNEMYTFQFDSIGRYVLQHPKYEDRMLFPMHDQHGEVRGVVSRIKPSTKNFSGPKALSYPNEGYNGLSWYTRACFNEEKNRHLFLVEDSVSALAILSLGYKAVSLNGTVLNEDRLGCAVAHAPELHLCLDADATSQSLYYLRKFGAYVPMQVHRLSRDVKDMPNEEAGAWLYYWCTGIASPYLTEKGKVV